MAIFPKRVNVWFWSENDHFSNFFFLGNIGKENVFYDILERKNAFLGYRNKNFKKLKNWHFFKWVNPRFLCINGNFSKFFFSLGNIGRHNVFYDILERQKASLGYKNKMFQSRKIDIFPKGLTHGFSPKITNFPTFFFRQYRPGKCLLRYSRTKKHHSRL